MGALREVAKSAFSSANANPAPPVYVEFGYPRDPLYTWNLATRGTPDINGIYDEGDFHPLRDHGSIDLDDIYPSDHSNVPWVHFAGPRVCLFSVATAYWPRPQPLLRMTSEHLLLEYPVGALRRIVHSAFSLW